MVADGLVVLALVGWAGSECDGGGVLLARGIHPAQRERVAGVMGAQQGGEGGGGIDRRGVEGDDEVSCGEPGVFGW